MTNRHSVHRPAIWMTALVVAFACLMGLTFKVNAVKGEVRSLERRIVAVERSRLLLETEFETRSNQQQLATWNAVEFGFVSPRGDQFIDHDWQLAHLASPRSPDVPAPIRIARGSDRAERSMFGQLASLMGDIPIEEGRTSLGSAVTLLEIGTKEDALTRSFPRTAPNLADHLAMAALQAERLPHRMARVEE